MGADARAGVRRWWLASAAMVPVARADASGDLRALLWAPTCVLVRAVNYCERCCGRRRAYWCKWWSASHAMGADARADAGGGLLRALLWASTCVLMRVVSCECYCE